MPSAGQFGFEFVGGEQTDGFGAVREVRVEAVDERFALAAVEDLHIFEADEFIEAGAVVSLDPAPDEEGPFGSSIEVTVSIGPMPRPVPDVVGRELAAAEARLAALVTPSGELVFETSAHLFTLQR